MITKDTCVAIWSAYREIEAGEQLLADMAKERERTLADKHAPTLRDAFGRVRQLQLGIPSGENAHRLLDDDDALVRLMAGNGVAIDALGLFAEPFEERSQIGRAHV